ncbi:MAG: hypothetical protein ACKVX7_07840 [Planctomycetota bacterium]
MTPHSACCAALYRLPGLLDSLVQPLPVNRESILYAMVDDRMIRECDAGHRV